ncbi:helix-turn-helix domain-containing protein [Brevibacterium sp. 5221]|uniref:Glycerol operon regulatory protein n=1 Tax=Brevibacterium rongguiense TaxID=2695267 RepID=A0A6N9H7Z9_9MICO|nr:IclR family transcriptional regulator [Brevibacterium rongguiense]MYM20025.1 helix-turn-helix domain-containing protein [Brevibacterium rongguiense]
MSPASPARVQSVDRTLDVLEALARMGGSARGTDLAAEVGLPAPSVHRILATLMARGYVRQFADRRYALGSRLVGLGTDAAEQAGFAVQPILDRAAAALQETVNLAFYSHTRMTYVAQASSSRSMRMFTEVGRQVPCFNTGVGKAVLATMSEAKIRAALERSAASGLPAPDVEGLMAELRECRGRGFALDDEEQEAGVRCLAVAVPGGPAPAGISASAPTSRLVPSIYPRVAAQLRAAAEELAAHWDG